MKMDNLHELYVEEIKDLYNAEQQLVKALPKMAEAATHPELKQAFENHLEETKGHVQRLETILRELGEPLRGKKCHGMEGLIEEGKELIDEDPDEDVLDAGLISKAQHVEHYEMAGYGTCRTYAQLMGLTRQQELLQTTLDEEGAADKLLTALAENSINMEAHDESDNDESDSDEEEERSRRGNGSKGKGSSASSRGSKRAASSRWMSDGGSRSGGAKQSSSRGRSSR